MAPRGGGRRDVELGLGLARAAPDLVEDALDFLA